MVHVMLKQLADVNFFLLCENSFIFHTMQLGILKDGCVVIWLVFTPSGIVFTDLGVFY